MLPSLVIVLVLTTFTCGENPAIQVMLTNKGLQYGKHLGTGWIQDKLRNITLPDISGGIHISIFGTIHYTFTGVTIVQCDLPEPSVQFYTNVTGFKTSVSGLSIALTGEWRTHYGIIHDGGSFNLAIFNVDVTSAVELGKDADGRLNVTSASCTAEVGDVKIDFHGGASRIFQPFVKYFKGRIRGQIEDKICPTVEQYIGEFEHHLQATNVSFQVNQALAVDVPLTNLPFMAASSLSLGLKGEFYSTKSHADPPFKAQPFTLPEQPGYMLSLGLSEFTANSASYGYFSAGLLQALINDSMIPPSSPVHLNTTSMGPFIPQLPKLFPDLLMKLQVYAREAPVFSFQPGAVKLGFLGAVKAFAVQPNTTLTPLFKLNSDSAFSGKMWVDGGRLKGSVAMDNFTLTLAASEVGTFQTAALETLVKTGIKMGVLSKLNEKLAEGFVLPRMHYAQLVNSVLKVEEGFVAVWSDAVVWPTESGFN
uniref:bactericidal permeability-increasing protein n=1 Tax=Centroberyx gerrardi TaxID=166262 RepID=UPI003AAD0A8C